MSLKCLTEMMSAVHAVEAIQRIPQSTMFPPRYRIVTYFSEQDVWLYQAVMDNRVCPICKGHEEHKGTGRFRGDHLRAKFPYLEIGDINTIQVNVHPNCRCYLTRLLHREEKE